MISKSGPAFLLLWELACSRWDRRDYPDLPRRLHREQARSHKGVAFNFSRFVRRFAFILVNHPRRFRSLAPVQIGE
ncbi:hypothetical protein CJU77_05795 [Pseudomonas fragi]|nr:hypothetical protein CJU77_05795 [Pseudomonas fragi]